jgi:hypothetical protein
MWNVAGGYSGRGRIYINTDSKVGSFVSLFGHELLHHIRKTRPAIYDFFAESAKLYYHGVDDYRAKYEYSTETNKEVIEEMLGDFVGDALPGR